MSTMVQMPRQARATWNHPRHVGPPPRAYACHGRVQVGKGAVKAAKGVGNIARSLATSQGSSGKG